ncbi:MAG: ester cyclase [Polyangiaceae bacterium]|nr:ester cyclase [Polyangiaceae bacterium]
MVEDKTAVIERYFGELFNEGRLELVDELLHEDYVNHSPSPGLPAGREGVRVVVALLRTAFPDLRYTLEDVVVGRDAVATRTTMRGTHRGDFFGLAPTGRTFEVAQMTIEHFRGGRIVAHHRLTDLAALAEQLAPR